MERNKGGGEKERGREMKGREGKKEKDRNEFVQQTILKTHILFCCDSDKKQLKL